MDVPSEGSIDRLDRGVSLWEFAQEIGVAESFHIRERDVDGMALDDPESSEDSTSMLVSWSLTHVAEMFILMFGPSQDPIHSCPPEES